VRVLADEVDAPGGAEAGLRRIAEGRCEFLGQPRRRRCGCRVHRLSCPGLAHSWSGVGRPCSEVGRTEPGAGLTARSLAAVSSAETSPTKAPMAASDPARNLSLFSARLGLVISRCIHSAERSGQLTGAWCQAAIEGEGLGERPLRGGRTWAETRGRSR